jgi:hypothetical protein
LEHLISAILSNPALSARLQSNEHGQQWSQSQSKKNRESSKQASGAIEPGEQEKLPNKQKEADHVKEDVRNVKVQAELDDLTKSSRYSGMPSMPSMPSPTRKALMKQRRSMIVHDSASEDEIPVKRPKTKSYTRT